MGAVSPLVLIVDDDEAVRNALQFALQLAGLTVGTHKTGTALLSDPALERAGCVIVDDRLPEMEDFGLLHRLRARFATLPFIVLTGHATSAVRVGAAGAGLGIVLEKPFFGNRLAETVRALLATDHAAVRDST